MYTITIDGRPLYYPLHDDLQLISPVLGMKASKAGTLTFSVPPTHAEYGQFVKLKTICAVYKDNGQYPIWKGRVFYTRLNFDGSLYVECEGFISYLVDTNMRTYEYSGTLRGFLEYIITTHNAQVAADKQITIGTVTVTDPNNYIHRSSSLYISCLEAFENGLIKTHGGYARLRYTAAGTVLDWLAGTSSDLPTATQKIEYGENLTALTQEISAEETYTACIPLGAKQQVETDTGDTVEMPLTIESVNGGLDYIVNQTALSLYGWICAPIDKTTWEDVTVASNLLAKARTFLDGTGIMLKNTIKLTAIDLSNMDVSIDSFDFLDRVQVQSTPHNISGTYILSEMDVPLDDPTGATITLGDSALSLTDAHRNQGVNVQERIEQIIGTVSGNAAQEAAHYSEIAKTTERITREIEDTAAAILTTMTNEYTRQTSFEDYKRTVSSEFSQSAEAYNWTFTEIRDTITRLASDTNRQYEEIKKYISFDGGDILLGLVGNSLVLKISYDRISFLLNNVEIAYFSSNRMYVENLEAIKTLTCGSYSFTPRANGNLSLVMTAQPGTQGRTIWNSTTTNYSWVGE